MIASLAFRPRTKKRCSPVLRKHTQGALGVRADSETGLVYMRARWYDPQLARFISRDPIGLSGGANLYKYVSNPSRTVDPMGLTPLEDIQYYLGSLSSEARDTLARQLSTIPIYQAKDIPGTEFKNAGAATVLIDGKPSIIFNSNIPGGDVPQVLMHELIHYFIMLERIKKKKRKSRNCRSAKEIIEEEKFAHLVQALFDLVYPAQHGRVMGKNRKIRDFMMSGDLKKLDDYLDEAVGGNKIRIDEILLQTWDSDRNGVPDDPDAGFPEVNLHRRQIPGLRRYSFL